MLTLLLGTILDVGTHGPQGGKLRLLFQGCYVNQHEESNIRVVAAATLEIEMLTMRYEVIFCIRLMQEAADVLSQPSADVLARKEFPFHNL